MKIDVFSINETWLDNTVSDGEIAIQDFQVFRADRDRRGGGTLLYVRDSLKVKHRKDLTPENKELEVCWIEIKPSSGSVILVCSLYRPPSANEAYYDSMLDNITMAQSQNKEIIILGDLNIDYKVDENYIRTLCTIWKISLN